MKKIMLGNSGLEVPAISLGCMRIYNLDKAEIKRLIETSMDVGVNFFDHADVYGNGDCESLFSEAIDMTPSVREKMFLQSKCGIVPRTMYDFSKEHIIKSVEGSLRRLKTDYLDVLLLHRPDALVEPEEVSEAFDKLFESGKVRHFGVSNHNPMQVKLLQKYLNRPIVANQLQLSIVNSTMISAGVNVNRKEDNAVDRDGGILDFCRLENITVQPWSPFLADREVFLGNTKYGELNSKLREIGEKYNVSKITVVVAWILRHPAKMQPIVGTTNPERLIQCARAVDIELTRQEWYEIFKAAGNRLP